MSDLYEEMTGPNPLTPAEMKRYLDLMECVDDGMITDAGKVELSRLEKKLHPDR